MAAEPEVEETFEEFWRDIVTNADGTLDVDQVKRELHDYRTLLREVPRVYQRVTGGRISKPNTHADAVIGIVDELEAEREPRHLTTLQARCEATALIDGQHRKRCIRAAGHGERDHVWVESRDVVGRGPITAYWRDFEVTRADQYEGTVIQ